MPCACWFSYPASLIRPWVDIYAAVMCTHHCHLILLYLKAGTHFTFPLMSEDWVDLGPVFYAAYNEAFLQTYRVIWSYFAAHLLLCFMLQILFRVFGIREFFPSNEIIRALASHLCNHDIVRCLCENFVFLISGFDKQQMNVVSTFCLFPSLF